MNTLRMAELGPAFIRRVYAASSVLGLLGATFVSVYAGWAAGAAWLVGLAISLVNFKVLEYALVRLLRPEPKWSVGVVLAVAFKVPLLLGSIFVALQILRLPTLWFSFGFFLLFLVIVLKALGRLMTAVQQQRDAGTVASSGIASGGATDLANVKAEVAAGLEGRPGQAVARKVREGITGSEASRESGPVDKARMLVLGCVFAVGLAAAGTLGTVGTQWIAEQTGWVADSAMAQSGGSHADDPASGHGADEHEAGAHGDDHDTDHGDAHGTGHDGADGEHHGDDHGGHDQYHFPTLFWYLKAIFPSAGWIDVLIAWETVLFSVIVAIFLSVIAHRASRNPDKIPGPLQNVVEMAVEGFDDFVRGIIGPEGRRYVPFIGTLFFYIWFMNLFGLVPAGFSPTSVFDTTFALAICVFLYVQFIAITRLGPKNYVLHLAGDPKDASGWAVAPLQLPLHIIGELAKPVSLSLRLFGNIMGEDKLLAVFAVLGAGILAFQPLPIGIPLHLPFMFLALLASTVQAFIFALLTTIYIFQVLPHDHGDEHH